MSEGVFDLRRNVGEDPSRALANYWDHVIPFSEFTLWGNLISKLRSVFNEVVNGTDRRASVSVRAVLMATTLQKRSLMLVGLVWLVPCPGCQRKLTPSMG